MTSSRTKTRSAASAQWSSATCRPCSKRRMRASLPWSEPAPCTWCSSSVSDNNKVRWYDLHSLSTEERDGIRKLLVYRPLARMTTLARSSRARMIVMLIPGGRQARRSTPLRRPGNGSRRDIGRRGGKRSGRPPSAATQPSQQSGHTRPSPCSPAKPVPHLARSSIHTRDGAVSRRCAPDQARKRNHRGSACFSIYTAMHLE